MDLATPIWTSASDGTVHAIDDYTLDMAFGKDEQDFELSFAYDAAGRPCRLHGGETVSIDGTEYGGVVDYVESSEDGMRYHGRTWHGILARKVVMPPAYGGNVTESGDANACIADIISRIDLAGTMEAETTPSGIGISGYQLDRFCDAYSAIAGMLAESGARLAIRKVQGRPAILSAVAVSTVDGTAEDVEMDVTQAHRVTNHLVCAGEGQQGQRTIVHLYADAQGRISKAQTLKGVDELAETYSYSSADAGELERQGTKRLAEQQGGSVRLTYRGRRDLHVGDIVSALDVRTGTRAAATVVKKVVKADGGILSVSCEVGEATATGDARGGMPSAGGGGGGIAYAAGPGIKIESGRISADVTQDELDAVSTKAEEARKQASDAAAYAGSMGHDATTTDHGLMSAADKSKLDGIEAGAQRNSVTSVQGRTGAVAISKADVGLGSADDTPDSAKRVATAKRLDVARRISIAGTVTGSATFDGSRDVTITVAGQQAAAGFLAAHPVGSYYETSDGTYNPADNGGTWEPAPSLGAYRWHRIR